MFCTLEGKCINFKDDNLSIFTQLGLTIRQAQVYLANAQLGQATAKAITKSVQADRTEIYRALIELEKLGLTQRLITNPVIFIAVAITEAFSILLQRNAEKHNQIQTESENFIKKFKEQNHEKPSPEDVQFHLTTGMKAESRELSRNLAETKTSTDGIIDWEGFLGLANSVEAFQKALERGVKIRIITHMPEGDKMPQIIQTLMKSYSLELKFASKFPKGNINILDQKSVHIITPHKDTRNGINVLRSNDPDLIELAQDYFDIKWQSAITPCWDKKNHHIKAKP